MGDPVTTELHSGEICHALWKMSDPICWNAATLITQLEHKDTSLVACLTLRENEVLEELAMGLTAKEVGAKLGVSDKTIERHRCNIGQKLKCKNLVQLTRIAIRAGLAPLHEDQT